MKFEVWQQGITEHPTMTIDAIDEVNAWKILKRAGIRNKSKLIELIKIDD